MLYWTLHRSVSKQNILLLVASYVFYGFWDWRFLSLLTFSSIVDYLVANKIENSNNSLSRRRWLQLSLFSNLGLLALFKYFDFFAESFASLMLNLGWEVDAFTLNLILPVGISFYTFQTLSYTIDVYRGNIKPSKSLLNFATYVSFFPQLVAGPIERASNLMPQIESSRSFKYSMAKEGILQMFVGLFRKVVIADNLAVYVDTVYGAPELYGGTTLLLATIFWAFQIYFDFSGYSDIAIGTAKLFGFEFNRNFNLPYFSKSITEFWRRWHISLSSWLKDYLYITLGGNRKGLSRTYINLMITMLLGGLWHGASWNFVIWGFIHGLVLGIEKYLFNRSGRNSFGWIGSIYTFGVVILAWIFFRASTLDDAIYILSGITTMDFSIPFVGNLNVMLTSISMLLIGGIFDSYLFKKDIPLEKLGSSIKESTLCISIVVMVTLMVLFQSTSQNFIYFQF